MELQKELPVLKEDHPAAAAGGLGVIFQDCNLLDTLTAYENIALSLSIIRAPAQKIDRRVREMADFLGIADSPL